MVGEKIRSPYGTFPSTYRCARLADVCVEEGGVQTGPFGSQLHQRDYVSVGTPIITVEHLGENRIIHQDLPKVSKEDKKRLSRYVLQLGDIVFSRVGSVDLRALVREDEVSWLFSGRLLRVRPKRDLIDSDYLSWFFGLPSFREYIRQIAFGATMPSLNTKIMSDLPVCFPSIDEQRAIAQILGSLDDKIDLNRKMNETLEAMARAIFKSWFVDFDPVRAKAEGRDPGLPKEIADLFPDQFQDSELGEIPKGWEIKTIGDLADIVGGSTPSTKESAYWEGGIHYWATPKDLSALTVPVLLSTERRITDAGLSQISSGLLPSGTVLLSSRAPIGYLAVTEVPAAINQGFIAMKPKMNVPNLFLLLWAHSAHGEILSRANGSTFLEISKSNFRPIPIITPPGSVFKAFGHLAKPIYQKLVNNEHETRNLGIIRDSLLPRLISGELRTKESKPIVKKVEVINVATAGKKHASPQFQEAILISALVRALSDNKFSLSRYRYTKFSYFIHRKMGDDVLGSYLKKAAGPYNPKTRYEGPESIAIKHKYISLKGQDHFAIGANVNDIDKYFQNYNFKEAFTWAIKKFKYVKDVELGLLATVDRAVLDLQTQKKPVSSKSIREFIGSHDEWAPKLNQPVYTEFNISKSLRELRNYFPKTYRGV